ncbi:MAG: hypothetical protein KF912_02140 [Phycisphaeraceae bacterium]|nr:hypothetical protein [Phycisphaeraceae bacterium]MBX3366101.1 hypothetical protein [Phycisphaeraceae bacterium]
MNRGFGRRFPATLAVVIGLAASSAVFLGFTRQPGHARVAPRVEHGVLTFVGTDATFLTSDARARRWQEIVKAAGQPVVEEYNRMSIVDTMVNGGWEIVEYEFLLDAANGDVERYLLRRTR